MKTKLRWDDVVKIERRYQFLIFFTLTSFFLIGGCGDEKREEIHADEVRTTAVRAEVIPAWVPSNTNPDIRFYFIPEIGIYYDAFVGDYVYWNGSFWVYSAVLPVAYIHFDLYDANIVFLSVGVVSPWYYHSYYVAQYPVYDFVGYDYYISHHGWRFYDENGAGFYGPHKHVKYNVHYTVQNHYKGGKDKFKYDYAEHKRNHLSQSGTDVQENKSETKKEKPPPMLKRMLPLKKNVI